MWAGIIFYNYFLVPVRKIISVQEIYSDSLFKTHYLKLSKNAIHIYLKRTIFKAEQKEYHAF